MLPVELWHDIIDWCSPLSLFFLDKTCLAFRAYLQQTFKVMKKRHAVPDATSYEELAYFLSLRREEQVKYCARHDWPKTFALLPSANTSLCMKGKQSDLFFIPTSYEILYPISRVRPIIHWISQTVKFGAKEGAKFFLNLTKEKFITFAQAIDEKDYYKIPLALQRKQILANDPERMETEATFYWLLTGEDLSPQLDKSAGQEYRDFLACEGAMECPVDKERDHLFPVLCYHASASFLLRHEEFKCNGENSEVVLSRQLFTQDEFFSVLKEGDWCAYFAEHGMEHSYQRYLTERNGNAQSIVYFLENGHLEAFLRNFVPGQKLVWPCSMRLALQSELVKFALGAPTSKAK